LANKYTSHARSGVSTLKQKLQSLRHRGTSCTEFLNTAKICADNPTAAGKPVEEEDLISYIVRGLYPSFNPLIVSCSFALQNNMMSFDDFQSKLLSYEILIDNQNHGTTEFCYDGTYQRPL
jgi:hypothetical protein